jgi:hypothetical protein
MRGFHARFQVESDAEFRSRRKILQLIFDDIERDAHHSIPNELALVVVIPAKFSSFFE